MHCFLRKNPIDTHSFINKKKKDSIHFRCVFCFSNSCSCLCTFLVSFTKKFQAPRIAPTRPDVEKSSSGANTHKVLQGRFFRGFPEGGTRNLAHCTTRDGLLVVVREDSYSRNVHHTNDGVDIQKGGGTVRVSVGWEKIYGRSNGTDNISLDCQCTWTGGRRKGRNSRDLYIQTQPSILIKKNRSGKKRECWHGGTARPSWIAAWIRPAGVIHHDRQGIKKLRRKGGRGGAGRPARRGAINHSGGRSRFIPARWERDAQGCRLTSSLEADIVSHLRGAADGAADGAAGRKTNDKPGTLNGRIPG